MFLRTAVLVLDRAALTAVLAAAAVETAGLF
jgi:hypothetical protein